MILIISYIMLLLYIKGNELFFRQLNSTSIKRLFLFFVIGSMILFHYLYFKSNVSIDLKRYEWNFIYRYSNPRLSGSYEKGFILISNLISKIYTGSNGYVYILIFTIIINLGYLKFSEEIEKKYRINVFLTLFLIVSSLLFLQNLYLLKQGISMTIFQLSILPILFDGNKKIKHSLILFTSVLFHDAAIVPILIVLIYLFLQKIAWKQNRLKILIKPLLLIGIIGVLYLIKDFIGNSINILTNFRGLPYYYLLLVIVKNKIYLIKEYDMFNFFLFMICLTYILSSFNSLFLRINLYFIPIALVYSQILYYNLDITKFSRNTFYILLLLPSIYELTIRIGGL